jgi:hypothetical protein
LEQFADRETLERSDNKPSVSEYTASSSTKQECFNPLGRVMRVLILQVFEVFQALEGLSSFVIQDTTERSIINWFEISVASEGRVVLVLLLEVVFRTPVLVLVGRIEDVLLYCVLKYHLLYYYL